MVVTDAGTANLPGNVKVLLKFQEPQKRLFDRHEDKI